jgi:hypothetical protein
MYMIRKKGKKRKKKKKKKKINFTHRKNIIFI